MDTGPVLPRQQGAALLILLLTLFAGSMAWFLGQATRQPAFSPRDRGTELALAEAKEALLGYAAAYPEYHLKGSPARAALVPGHLPCPDQGIGIEGQESPTCGSTGVTVIGRLPWKTLGIPPPRDGAGECLWYAVSGHYKANPKADLLNPDTPGQFQVIGPDGLQVLAGASPAERPVAVLFAPGPALAGQSRQHLGGECGQDYVPEHFLDLLQGIANGTPDPSPEGLSRVVAGVPGQFFNDRLLWISREELFARRVERRTGHSQSLFDGGYTPASTRPALAQRLAACLARFAASDSRGRLPWAAPLAWADTPPSTFQNDRFLDQTGLHQGRPPFLVSRTLASLGAPPPTLPSFATCIPPSGSGCRLLRTDNCPELLAVAGYPTPADSLSASNSPDGWWDKWKDHLFYAVARDFAPASGPAGNCGTPGNCLWVNGQGPYAAVVVYAGAALPGQSRQLAADRFSPANYLEGGNADLFQNGGNQLVLAGNDQIACIRPDLSIVPNCGNAACGGPATTLAGKASGLQNLCRNGASALPECQAAATALAGCACQGAAQAFITQPCLASLNPPACQAALQALKTCN